MSGVAKPLHPWAGSSAQLPRDAPVQHVPPNLPASHVLESRQPPLPLPRWPHLFFDGPPLPPLLLPRAGKPAPCLSQLVVATLPVRRAPYSEPWGWRPALAQPPGHLDHPPKFQPPPAKFLAMPLPVKVPIFQWGVPPPRLHLCPPLLHLPPLAPPWASPPTPAPHPGLELTGIVHLLGVHWPRTPQDNLLCLPVHATPSTIQAPPVWCTIWA